MRPLVYRGTFQGLTGRLLVRLVNALEVPDLDVASVQAKAEAQKVLDTLSDWQELAKEASMTPREFLTDQMVAAADQDAAEGSQEALETS